MSKRLIILILIGIINLVLISIIYKILQNEKIYKSTLGQISQNYERKVENNNEITKVTKPYTEVNEEKFERWDAAIYHCISIKMYEIRNDCYGKVSAAFFPLFPLLWKVTNSTFIGISIINYFLFIFSVAILVLLLLKETFINQVFTYSLLISLPSSIVYYLPYSESLFLFTMLIAVIGLLKDKYWIYFIGIYLLSTVRPATIFVGFSILFVELL
jgi:hypothetical protein